MKKRILGIIGGSGLYQIEGLENIKWKKVNTSWGEPSDRILSATLNKKEVYFISKLNDPNELYRSILDIKYDRDLSKRISICGFEYAKKYFSIDYLGSLQNCYDCSGSLRISDICFGSLRNSIDCNECYGNSSTRTFTLLDAHCSGFRPTDFFGRGHGTPRPCYRRLQ